MGKYSTLEEFLLRNHEEELDLIFSEIEEIINDTLPVSAYKYKGWWSDSGHVQSRAWMNAGYSANVNLELKLVKFTRVVRSQSVRKEITYAESINDFNARWEISVTKDANSLQKFKNRITTVILKYVEDIEQHGKLIRDFCLLIGVPYKQMSFPELMITDFVHAENSILFTVYNQINDIKDYAMNIQALFWVLHKHNQERIADHLFIDLVEVINLSPFIGITATKTRDGVELYPAGARLLDENIINTDLDWLDRYPDVKKLFSKSLSDFLFSDYTQENARSTLDNLRASLEKLIQNVLGNNNTIENNQKELKKFLKEREIHPNIVKSIGLFSHLGHYIEFMNDIKHSNPDFLYTKNEIEHMIYQTGIFIRLIVEAVR